MRVKKVIIRTGDLSPLGVKSTYCESRVSLAETFNLMFGHKTQSDGRDV